MAFRARTSQVLGCLPIVEDCACCERFLTSATKGTAIFNAAFRMGVAQSHVRRDAQHEGGTAIGEAFPVAPDLLAYAELRYRGTEQALEAAELLLPKVLGDATH